jgi:putative transposase
MSAPPARPASNDRHATRVALVALSRLIDWRQLLTVVKPETLIRWHRTGFRLFWRVEIEAASAPPLRQAERAVQRLASLITPGSVLA